MARKCSSPGCAFSLPDKYPLEKCPWHLAPGKGPVKSPRRSRSRLPGSAAELRTRNSGPTCAIRKHANNARHNERSPRPRRRNNKLHQPRVRRVPRDRRNSLAQEKEPRQSRNEHQLRRKPRRNFAADPAFAEAHSSVPVLKLSRYPRSFAATLAVLPSISEIPFLD